MFKEFYKSLLLEVVLAYFLYSKYTTKGFIVATLLTELLWLFMLSVIILVINESVQNSCSFKNKSLQKRIFSSESSLLLLTMLNYTVCTYIIQ